MADSHIDAFETVIYGNLACIEMRRTVLPMNSRWTSTVEYCIEHGISRFEPGTQGEHKVPRGFEPTATWSAHWIADTRFRRAIDSYLEQERDAIDQYMESVREHTPFRRDES